MITQAPPPVTSATATAGPTTQPADDDGELVGGEAPQAGVERAEPSSSGGFGLFDRILTGVTATFAVVGAGCLLWFRRRVSD